MTTCSVAPGAMSTSMPRASIEKLCGAAPSLRHVHGDVGIGWDRELLSARRRCHVPPRRPSWPLPSVPPVGGSPALGAGSGRGRAGGLACRLGRGVAHGRDARDVLTRFFSTASATRGEHDERERSHRPSSRRCAEPCFGSTGPPHPRPRRHSHAGSDRRVASRNAHAGPFPARRHQPESLQRGRGC